MEVRIEVVDNYAIDGGVLRLRILAKREDVRLQNGEVSTMVQVTIAPPFFDSNNPAPTVRLQDSSVNLDWVEGELRYILPATNTVNPQTPSIEVSRLMFTNDYMQYPINFGPVFSDAFYLDFMRDWHDYMPQEQPFWTKLPTTSNITAVAPNTTGLGFVQVRPEPIIEDVVTYTWYIDGSFYQVRSDSSIIIPWAAGPRVVSCFISLKRPGYKSEFTMSHEWTITGQAQTQSTTVGFGSSQYMVYPYMNTLKLQSLLKNPPTGNTATYRWFREKEGTPRYEIPNEKSSFINVNWEGVYKWTYTAEATVKAPWYNDKVVEGSVVVDMKLGTFQVTTSVTPDSVDMQPHDEPVLIATFVGYTQEAGDIVTYKWTSDSIPGVTLGTEKQFSPTWIEVGTHQYRCDVTITRANWNTYYGTAFATVNSVKGGTFPVGDMTIKMLNVPTELEPKYTVNGMEMVVEGVPPECTLEYEWRSDNSFMSSNRIWNGWRVAASSDSSTMIYARCRVSHPSYDSPAVLMANQRTYITFIDFNRGPFMYEYRQFTGSWGYPGKTLSFSPRVVHPDTTQLGTIHTLRSNKNITPEVWLHDGYKVPEGDALVATTGAELVEVKTKMLPSMLGADIFPRWKGTAVKANLFGPGPFDRHGSTAVPNIGLPRTAGITLPKMSERNYAFVLNGQEFYNGLPFQIKKAPGNTLTITVANHFNYEVFDDDIKAKYPEYVAELAELSKKGTYELIDYQGNVAATAVNGVFTYDLPDEIKTLTGKVRHTLVDDRLFTPAEYKVEMNIIIEIQSNPIVPTPTIGIVQTPSPARVGQSVVFTPSYTNLPDGHTLDTPTWNTGGQGEVSTPGENFTVEGRRNLGLRVVNTVHLNNFDSTVMTRSIVANIIGRQWPLPADITFSTTVSNSTPEWSEPVTFTATSDFLTKIENPGLAVAQPIGWEVGGVMRTETGSPVTFSDLKPGANSVIAIKRWSHPEYDGFYTLRSPQMRVTVAPRVLDAAMTLTPAAALIGINESRTLNASVQLTPPATDATVTYKWYVDGVVKQTSGQNFAFTSPTAGVFTVKCEATVVARDHADIIVSKESTITVQEDAMTLTVIARADQPIVLLDDTYTVSCEVTGVPVGGTIQYLWDTGETTPSITVTAALPTGIRTHRCTITAEAVGYATTTQQSNIVQVVVSDAYVPAECPILYIHPLPHRETAYIWCGWWVMDAIQEMTERGKNWRIASGLDTPYYCHLRTLSTMLNATPEVDVQESRNGRIIGRNALEIGIIY